MDFLHDQLQEQPLQRRKYRFLACGVQISQGNAGHFKMFHNLVVRSFGLSSGGVGFRLSSAMSQLCNSEKLLCLLSLLLFL